MVSTFKTRGGIIGSISIGWNAPQDINYLQIYGTGGSLVVGSSYFEKNIPR